MIAVSTSQDISVLQSCESLPKPNLPLSPASISKSTKEPSESQARHVTVHLPAKLPKDRPFANIVAVNTTTVAPRHLQTILDQRGTSPAEKSRRLRAALRRDNQMLFAYCLLLAGKLLALTICRRYSAEPHSCSEQQWARWLFTCLLEVSNRISAVSSIPVIDADNSIWYEQHPTVLAQTKHSESTFYGRHTVLRYLQV